MSVQAILNGANQSFRRLSVSNLEIVVTYVFFYFHIQSL
jgi:hypothetical protein